MLLTITHHVFKLGTSQKFGGCVATVKTERECRYSCYCIQDNSDTRNLLPTQICTLVTSGDNIVKLYSWDEHIFNIKVNGQLDLEIRTNTYFRDLQLYLAKLRTLLAI